MRTDLVDIAVELSISIEKLKRQWWHPFAIAGIVGGSIWIRNGSEGLIAAAGFISLLVVYFHYETKMQLIRMERAQLFQEHPAMVSVVLEKVEEIKKDRSQWRLYG